MSDVVFADKFIGFVDILGFKKLVEAAEAGNSATLSEARAILKRFGSNEKRDKLEKYGPKICPQASYVRRNLDFRICQMSDSILISCEISPVGIISLIEYCWNLAFSLLQKGIMCRGSITRGSISHNSDMDFVGSGAHRVFENEKKVAAFKRDANEQGTPFVEIDHVVCAYVNDCEDWCVKEMASRFASFDGKVVALFPFKRLAHNFVIGKGVFDANREKESNNNVRLILKNLRERVIALVDASNPRALCKGQHYVEALDTQLAICDRTDDLIRQLSE
jgi:hypothetical protein